MIRRPIVMKRAGLCIKCGYSSERGEAGEVTLERIPEQKVVLTAGIWFMEI